MAKLGDFSAAQLRQRLKSDGVVIQIGLFAVHVRSSISFLADSMLSLYCDYPVRETGYADFHVSLERSKGLRRWYRPQVIFSLDGRHPFLPLPLSQTFPMFEWTLNWCVANHMHHFLILHSAVVEKAGKAVILPAPPGSGKSTLCAGLVSRGWRLLSDEMALLEPGSGELVAAPRPVSLKNESVEVMRRYAGAERIGPVATDTNKGNVAHMRAPIESLRRADEKARPAFVIFPRYQAGAATALTERSRGSTVMGLVNNSFNYNVLGRRGFELLVDVVAKADCYDFVYSELDEAVALFDQLVNANE